jgi:peptidylprolyl isomerase
MPQGQRSFLILAVSLLALAGCGGGDSSSSSTSASSPAAESESWFAAEVGTKVSVPGGSPPERLVVKDLKNGSGPAAKPGDEVEFEYVDVNYTTEKVQSVAVPGAPYHLVLGSNNSIPGWEKGIVGMKVGGRRELIIPPSLGNGEASLLRVALVGVK